MSDADLPSETKNRRKSKKKLNKISFDEEIVPRSRAQQLNISAQEENPKENNLNEKPRKTKRKQKREDSSSANTELNLPKKEKRKKKSKDANNSATITELEESSIQTEETPDEQTEVDPANPEVKQEESIRARKRRKHQQLLLEKKVKVDLIAQDKSLNYLSRWKHDRDHWKFEKLRQMWLHQNMFDFDKVPDQFWETLVEYFSNAQGKIRKTIMDDALKIIENSEQEIGQNSEDNEKEGEEDDTDNNLNKVQRARNIVQCLQE